MGIAYWIESKKLTKKCAYPGCGKEFTTHKRQQKYCSEHLTSKIKHKKPTGE